MRNSRKWERDGGNEGETFQQAPRWVLTILSDQPWGPHMPSPAVFGVPQVNVWSRAAPLAPGALPLLPTALGPLGPGDEAPHSPLAPAVCFERGCTEHWGRSEMPSLLSSP